MKADRVNPAHGRRLADLESVSHYRWGEEEEEEEEAPRCSSTITPRRAAIHGRRDAEHWCSMRDSQEEVVAGDSERAHQDDELGEVHLPVVVGVQVVHHLLHGFIIFGGALDRGGTKREGLKNVSCAISSSLSSPLLSVNLSPSFPEYLWKVFMSICMALSRLEVGSLDILRKVSGSKGQSPPQNARSSQGCMCGHMAVKAEAASESEREQDRQVDGSEGSFPISAGAITTSSFTTSATPAAATSVSNTAIALFSSSSFFAASGFVSPSDFISTVTPPFSSTFASATASTFTSFLASGVASSFASALASGVASSFASAMASGFFSSLAGAAASGTVAATTGSDAAFLADSSLVRPRCSLSDTAR
ncbi:hypothetical protein EYF80_020864 [Liparis tanakae]|uniref:Uncharacterized protein n=1 Tax=Liparis tanakae TaxID=230148 RepID=A0A4Z2HVL0_9TELE|nr:hypothetical protein EYF80_020864 [Liparis tanakae]